MSAGGRASLFSSAHLGTRLACLQIRALPWTGGWQWIQVAGGDKAASGTLQMQALAEWRLDGEPGQAEAFDNAADVYRLHSRIGHLLSSQETPGLCTLAQAQQTVWWCTQWRLHWKWLLLPPRCPFLRQLAKQKDGGYSSNCVSKIMFLKPPTHLTHTILLLTSQPWPLPAWLGFHLAAVQPIPSSSHARHFFFQPLGLSDSNSDRPVRNLTFTVARPSHTRTHTRTHQRLPVALPFLMCAKSAMQKDNPDRRLEVWGGSWVGAGTGGGWAERLTKWLSLSSGDSRPPLKQRLNIWKGEDDNPQSYLINSRFSLIKKAGGKKERSGQSAGPIS